MVEPEFIDVEQELSEILKLICTTVQRTGGRALLVGGCVRDALLGCRSKDFDIEVYGVQPERLYDVLAERFIVDLVGEAFGVVKLHQYPVDVSIPRRESKSGLGHRDFMIMSDPSMTPEEAASRRDFTINSMAWDPLTNELIDPYDGKADLEHQILRHTTEKFTEDPLRVLRGMQFAARFELEVVPETVDACRQMKPEALADERVFEEWRKLILYGRKPSLGLKLLKDCGWIQHYPELAALIGCEQDPEWHPEGDVWSHTLHCMDAFAEERTGDEWEDLVVGLAVLCHDLGKPSTTAFTRGKLRSLRHEAEGEVPTKTFLRSLTKHRELSHAVIPLVTNHMAPLEFYRTVASDTAIRRLALRTGRIDRLVRVAKADHLGRPPIALERFEAGEWLLKKAAELEVTDSMPKPILMGRHLIGLGMAPGRHFGQILRAGYEAQLDGKFSSLESGLRWIRSYLKDSE